MRLQFVSMRFNILRNCCITFFTLLFIQNFININEKDWQDLINI